MIRQELGHLATVSAEFSVEGGGTKKEFKENLLKAGEEPWNKWCNCSKNYSWIKIEFEKAVSFAGLGFKSANDCPERDPAEAVISITDFYDFIPKKIAKLAMRFSRHRWEIIQFPDISAENIQSITFEFRNNNYLPEIQLGEIIFYQK